MQIKAYTIPNTRLQSQRKDLDAKAGPKVCEQLYRELFGHDVHELVGGWHVEDTDFPQRDLLADEVDINLDMLGATMMDSVGDHIDRADIVTIDNGRKSKHDVKLLEKLAQPTTLGDDVGDRHDTLFQRWSG